MAMGRPKATLVLDSELHEQLESLASSQNPNRELVGMLALQTSQPQHTETL